MLKTSTPPQLPETEAQLCSEASQDLFATRISIDCPSTCVDLPLRAPLLPWANVHDPHISEQPRIVTNHMKRNDDFMLVNQKSTVDSFCPLMDPLQKESSFYCESECSDVNGSTSKCELDNILELNGFRCAFCVTVVY